ncbi:MAG: ferritin family protein [Firmicutes bacterium]|jgi:rubrerythrin|nr:ferritin family protein [Bacillota bacterium]
MTALEFAIQMELDGEKYYLEQAEKNKDNNLYTVFKILADEERVHAEILEKHAKEIEYEMDESAAYTEFQNVFVSLDDFNVETKAAPDQLDGYRLALQKEQESIDLYEKMLAEAKRDEDRVLFEFLVEQEKIHYQVFDDIIQHLIKAEQWVEDAEFGRRMEEY